MNGIRLIVEFDFKKWKKLSNSHKVDWAAQCGNLDWWNKVIDSFNEISPVPPPLGLTPLHLAAWSGHLDMVKTILQTKVG